MGLFTPPPHPEPRGGMPFTGVATFARAPLVTDLSALQADFAVYGCPFDCAIGYRPGQRLAPRAIRDLSTRFALPWGPDNPGYWDIGDDRWYLQGARLADVGDVDPLYFDLGHLDASAAAVVGAIAAAGAVPVGLGGDHSVTYPLVRGLAPLFAPGAPLAGRKLHLVQIDAHLDFTDSIGGFARSNSSPIRRASELPFVGGVTAVGIRGLRTNPAAYRAALDRGHRVVLMRDVRAQGLAAALAALPAGEPVYLTLDIDGLDPAICPGTSSPEPDGLTYAEVREILRAVAVQNRVVGVDVVEVNPYLDPGHQTALLAARLALEMMAFIHAARGGAPG